MDSTGSVAPLTFGALPFRPGTPIEVVFACRNAIIAAALPDGAVRIDTASAGKSARTRGGGLAAPITARIVYFLGGEAQTRQATVSCRLNSVGQVLAVL